MKKLPEQPQLEMFKTQLVSLIHPEHELCLLAKKSTGKDLKKSLRLCMEPSAGLQCRSGQSLVSCC